MVPASSKEFRDIQGNYRVWIHSETRTYVTYSQLLNTLLSYAVPETFKRSSIWQCIIKASRPCTALPPQLICLGIECDHVFGSKWLGNELFRLGFSVSYSEVNRFKKLRINLWEIQT